ncbi:extracellular solute-binding protein [Celeribacter indicus]|uniref:extracellular solute-binding protein n=1 Tax=Celeribacter indicus TaxID=1208324 RepID=UPI00089D6740|nr:extracellular solute-binding protein [Celeribacter indicus]SDX12232.1 carbohydrate ABC transporter substrate-binding protein, CUT1 family [Celeribacter indicus]
MTIKRNLIAGTALALSATAAMAQEEIVFVSCGSGSDPQAAVQAEHIADWEAANPDYTVNLEFVAWSQCQERVMTLAAAGNAPAVAYLGSRVLKQLSESGLIRPIDLSAEELDSYEPSVLSTVSFDQKVWGMPRAFSSQALFYNKTLFAEAGVDMPEGPTTWEELLAAAKAVSENTDADGFGMPADTTDTAMHAWMNFLYSNGGAILDADGNVTFDSPAVVETLAMYGELAKYSQNGPLAYDRASLEPLFSEGRIAMYTTGGWGRSKTGDVDYGIAFVPHGPSGESGSVLITDSLVVFDNTGVGDTAEDLVTYLTAPERQADFDLAGGWTPIRKTAAIDALIAEDPSWSYFIDSVPSGGSEPLFVDYIGMRDAINEAIQTVVVGDGTAEEAADTAQAELEDLLD